jgi:hypothetical protein
MTVNLGTYPKLIRCGRPTTDGREDAHGSVGPTKLRRGTLGNGRGGSDMAWATTTAKQLRPVQWSPWPRTGGDGEMRATPAGRPASQPATLHADLVVAPSSGTTVPAALRFRTRSVQGKEGSPVGRLALALAWTSTVHQRSYVQGELLLPSKGCDSNLHSIFS